MLTKAMLTINEIEFVDSIVVDVPEFNSIAPRAPVTVVLPTEWPWETSLAIASDRRTTAHARTCSDTEMLNHDMFSEDSRCDWQHSTRVATPFLQSSAPD